MTTRELMEGQSYFTLHFDENSECPGWTGDVCACWILVRDAQWRQSEVPNISYVWACKEGGCCKRNGWCFYTLAIPLRLMLSLGMDEPNVNKYIMHKINEVKKEKGNQPLVKYLSSCPIHMSQEFSERYGSVWIQCWGIMPKPLLLLQEEFM